MKTLALILSLTILTGCAIRDTRPPWERFEKTHEPLMLGHPDLVSADDDLETPNISP